MFLGVYEVYYERYYSRRRFRYTSVPLNKSNIKTIITNIRQADDLLSAVGAYERGNQRNFDYLHDCVAMVLGDNIFAGHGLKKRLKTAVQNAKSGNGATVFGYYVDDPERFGIVEFDKSGKAVSIEEKPEQPKSNYCVTGLYFYDNKVVKYAKNLKPSARGELEITDLNRIYLDNMALNVELLGQGFTWLDTGTHESLVEATNFVKTMEDHQHRKIACLEEIAYLNGWISREEVLEVYEELKKNQYGQYLMDVLNGKYIDELR